MKIHDLVVVTGGSVALVGCKGVIRHRYEKGHAKAGLYSVFVFTNEVAWGRFLWNRTAVRRSYFHQSNTAYGHYLELGRGQMKALKPLVQDA